jgi:hypothetical protein
MTYRIALPLLALLAAVGCSGRDATAPMSSDIHVGDLQALASSSASSVRSGTFQGVKECTGFTGGAGSFCEIVISNVKEIALHSRIYYLDPVSVFTPAGSDVVLDLPGPGNNAAYGHCALNLTTLTGLCTFSGGTGKFTNFQGSFVVSDPFDKSWHLEGAYSFN